MLERTIRQRRFLLFLVDLLATLLAFWLAYAIRFHVETGLWKAVDEPLQAYLLLTLPVCSIWLFMCQRVGLYGPPSMRQAFSELRSFIRAGVLGVIILFALTYALRIWPEPARVFVAFFSVGAVVFPMAGRWLVRTATTRWLADGMSVRRVLVVGASAAGRDVAEGIRQQAVGFRMVGFLDDKEEVGAEITEGIKVLGRVSELESCVRHHAIDEVIVALSGSSHEEQAALIEKCLGLHVVWKIVPTQYDMLLDRISVDEVAGVPLIGMKTSNIIGVNYAVKRTVDVVGALLLLLSSLPLMIVVAIAIKLTSPGPIFFGQTRIGCKQRPFRFLKFRSMVVDAEARKPDLADINEREGPVFKIRDDPRVTSVGRLIRKFSIDELPQLLHVLRGDMSLIGPRPPLPEEVAQYEEWQKRRLDAPPGITGLWQVSGRTRLDFDEMVQLDLHYLENWSLMLDLRIALRTILVVVFGFEH
ncbi:MAG TPA: sugar transferase [Sumerlaeia bacterium]|nr:sugar transferase [Sumerlaeia bacterium]